MNAATIHLNKYRKGFTLLELLVALTLLVIAMSIAFQAFSGTVRGWKRGIEVIDGIKHGDFAMQQIKSALNSTIYFFNPRKTYAFTFEKDSSGGLPADSISFVTSSGAMMPYDSPFARGPHRLRLFIDEEFGAPALFATALPAVPDVEDEESEFEAEPILVSTAVQGLEILVWDFENEEWTEEWEKENAVPERIQITIYVASDDEDEDPIPFMRVLEIPVAESVQDKLTGPSLK
ncbi:prepilin-type N-terminal cleavage/methylation domain-containing protein [Pontiella agarivorans]|uniref:Prepilin-type N-terminal cleavage/methylation domain-containing protein n=1 Tax=Pontiella agarivorans TaxID=3038953 RepID=A0ABU5MUP9_9BACT|nr:prepilin-type N-terminal cleavage/methylation domain-containing protein [Pontiella agarivorans]MDZ8117857.1 prepilin-type N-terminal cleavage/methylation domain-containing protein [Pontiella agarivorans]